MAPPSRARQCSELSSRTKYFFSHWEFPAADDARDDIEAVEDRFFFEVEAAELPVLFWMSPSKSESLSAFLYRKPERKFVNHNGNDDQTDH